MIRLALLVLVACANYALLGAGARWLLQSLQGCPRCGRRSCGDHVATVGPSERPRKVTP